MSNYRLKNPNVIAHQYQGEVISQLPDWAQNYSVYSAFNGTSPLYRNGVGVLQVPNLNSYTPCQQGDWLIFDGKTVSPVKAKVFETLYEPIPVENAPEAGTEALTEEA